LSGHVTANGLVFSASRRKSVGILDGGRTAGVGASVRGDTLLR
jgi:hypothetical protein